MLYKMINSLASRRFWNQTPPVSHRLLLFACDQPVWYWRCCGQSSPFFESHTEVHYITCGLSALCFKTHTAKAVALPLVYPAPHHLPVVCLMRICISWPWRLEIWSWFPRKAADSEVMKRNLLVFMLWSVTNR